MPDDDDVSVNVSGSVKGLDTLASDISRAVSSAASAVSSSSVTIRDYATEKNKQGAAAAELAPRVVAGSNIKLPELPAFTDSAQQIEAILEQAKALDAQLAKLQSAGQGSGAPAQRIAERIQYLETLLADLGEVIDPEAAPSKDELRAKKKEEEDKKKAEAAAAKQAEDAAKKKADEEAKLAKKQADEELKAAEKTEAARARLFSDAFNKASGGLSNRFAGAKDSIKLALGAESLVPIVAGVAAVAGLVGAVYAANRLIEESISAIKNLTAASLKAAMRAEHETHTLTGATGSYYGGKSAREEALRLARGTGIDPTEIIEGIPKLLAETHQGALGRGGGLELVVDVVAKTDPTKFKEISSVMAQAFETLRGGGAIEGVANKMVELGMISYETAHSLWQVNVSGMNMETQWAMLVAALRAGSDGAKDAKDKFGGLALRIEEAWSAIKRSVTEGFGAKLLEAFAPAMNRVAVMLENLGTRVKFIMTGLGVAASGIVQTLASWADTATLALGTLGNALIGGEFWALVGASMKAQILEALNAVINWAYNSWVWLGTQIQAIFKTVLSSGFWSGIGDYLVSAGYSFLSVLARAGDTLADALEPVLVRLRASVIYVGDWITKGKGDWGSANAQAKAEATIGDLVRGANIAGLEATGEFYANRGSEKIKDSVVKPEGFDRDPNILSSAAAAAAAEAAALIEKYAPELTNKGAGSTEADKNAPGLGYVTGQSGLKAVADSLQKVGGGGLAGGFSFETKLLEESRTQTDVLKSIERKLPQVSGAYGGAGGDQGTTVTTILTNIYNTVLSIANGLKTTASGGKQLVSYS